MKQGMKQLWNNYFELFWIISSALSHSQQKHLPQRINGRCTQSTDQVFSCSVIEGRWKRLRSLFKELTKRARISVEHRYLAIVRVYLEGPLVIDDHWTEVGDGQVTCCFKVVEYAAKVDRQSIVLKRQIREKDSTSQLQFILTTQH